MRHLLMGSSAADGRRDGLHKATSLSKPASIKVGPRLIGPRLKWCDSLLVLKSSTAAKRQRSPGMSARRVSASVRVVVK